MFFRFGVEGWEMWMAGSGMLLLCAVLVRRWAHYELTTERIIVRNGYTGREIQSSPLTDIREVTVHQGVVADFFGIGTLTISSASRDRVISLRGISDPEEVKIRIQVSARRYAQTVADSLSST
jgi:membrane protein YdbS with pleckstrin-like domain